MDTFVQGTFIEKVGEYGGYYDLKLRLPGGQIIPIFYLNKKTDRKHDPVSDLLTVDATYTILIILQVLRYVTYAPVTPPDLSFELVTKEFRSERSTIKRNDLLRGKVLDPSWDAASLPYQAIATPRIYERRYVLLETGIGNVVVSHKELQEELDSPLDQVAAGGYLEWKQGRMDLLAIIETRKS